MKWTGHLIVGGVLVGSLGGATAVFGQVEPGFNLVYDLPIGKTNNYQQNNADVPYTINNSALIAPGSFTRVAYLLTLAGSTTAGSPDGYVYVSFDTFSNNAASLGVPASVAYNAPIQQLLTHMNVTSNVGIAQGTNLSGNIEFWNSNYDPANSANIPNASKSTFDFGDNPNAGSYGSMQIHNYASSETVFAFNDWNGATSDIGIGNNTLSNGITNQVEPDWTFRGNAGDYTTRELQVFVNPEPASLSLLAIGALGLLARRRNRF